MREICQGLLVMSVVLFPAPLSAQVSVPIPAALPLVVQPTSPPASRLGGFQPEAGSLVTTGYDEITALGSSRISADVRQVRDNRGTNISGMRVTVRDSDRWERPFVDADEIPGLLQGLDALLEVRDNPTPFTRFEVRYATRDNLAFVAYNDALGSIRYFVQAGTPARATIWNLDAVELLKVRKMVEAALQKLKQADGR